MSRAELLYQLTLGISAAVGVGGLATWRVARSPAARRVRGAAGAVLALVAVAAWAGRWAEAGHLPLFGTWESALSLATAVTLAALWADRALGFEGAVIPVGALISAGLLAHGLGYDSAPWALTISERSLVVDVHALVSWAAFALFSVNVGLSAATLWRPGHDATSRWLAPSLEWAFFLHTAMIITGVVYRFLLLGRAWSFDPIETLGMIAWASYGTLLHMHFFAQWNGRKLAAWSLGLFVLLVLSYRGILFFPSWSTYHIFDIGLRQHVVH